MKLLKIAAFLLLCVCFVSAQQPATPQPAPAQQPQTAPAPAPAAQPQTSTTTQPTTVDIQKPMLEFANANSAKIAWTSKQSADLDMHYGTDVNSMTGAVNAIEHSGGDNHRATLINLQPNTTYFVQMTNKTGQPVGPVYSFKTPDKGGKPIHEQPLSQVQ